MVSDIRQFFVNFKRLPCIRRILSPAAKTQATKSLLRDDANNIIQWLQQMGDDGCRDARLLDDDGRLAAVLWSTKKQELAKLYGQVVIPDKPFKTNRGKWSVCQGFLRKEDIAAFVWAFNNYLKWCCDGGWYPPDVILANGAKPATAAIKENMPSTKHFLYPWHLFKNLKEHTDKHLHGNQDLLRACRTTFRSAECAATSEEFEACWGKFTAFHLPDGMKTYLSGLHERREM
ncbi:unnamed protein product [Phaeothamnion confervicola]